VPVLFFTLEEPGQVGTTGKFLSRSDSKAPAQGAPPPKADLPGMTISEALKDPVFWLMTLAAFIGLFIFNGMFPHIVPALVGRGFSQTTVVALQSSAILVSFAGALVGGWAVDRFQTAKIAAPISLAASLGAILTLLVSPSFGGVPLLGAILILAALSFSALFPMGMYFATRFFGLASLTEIVAVQFAITNIFAGLGAPLFGWIFDRTHSYDMVFMITAGLNLAVALIWLALPKYRFDKNIGQMPAPPKRGAPAAQPQPAA
jgi:cyanate permease